MTRQDIVASGGQDDERKPYPVEMLDLTRRHQYSDGIGRLPPLFFPQKGETKWTVESQGLSLFV